MPPSFNTDDDHKFDGKVIYDFLGVEHKFIDAHFYFPGSLYHGNWLIDRASQVKLNRRKDSPHRFLHRADPCLEPT